MQYSDDLTDVPVANNLVEMRERSTAGVPVSATKNVTSLWGGRGLEPSGAPEIASDALAKRVPTGKPVWAGHMEP